MADRYWRGGAGTWDATTTTNWSATSGGAGGASAPTSADNVIFNSASNATAYAVTVGTNAAALDITIAGPAAGNVTITTGATAVINCYGSWTSAATGVVFTTTSGANVNFLATTTGKTITTNNVTFGNLQVTLNGVGGAWSLGSAFTSTTNIIVTAGTFTTTASNYALTAGQISSSNSNVRSISLNASTITLSGASALTFTTATNLTFSAGTSTITCSNASPTFAGGAQTFNNVTFSSTAAGTTSITGINTFNVLTQAAQAAAGLRLFSLAANQTIATLTLSSGASAVTRTFVQSNTFATQRTLTVATLTAISDVDFRDIVAAGASAASPWTGTRLGNCKNNSNITFGAGTTKYFSTVNGVSANWSGTSWATSTGGTPALNNFPLAQDTCIIDDSGATVGDGLRTGNTVTIDANWNMGTLNFSNRTVAFNWTQGNSDPFLYGDVTLTTAMTMTTVTGTPTWTFANQGTVQTLNSAGVTIRLNNLSINSPGGGVSLTANTTVDLSPIVAPNVTGTVTLAAGTLTLNNNTLTTVFFNTSASTARTIAFGTGKIVVTGNAATIFNYGTATNLTVTGTSLVQSNYSGSTGTRTITLATTGGTEANSINFEITSGSDIVALGGSGGVAQNLNFTGFTGTIDIAAAKTIYGNFDVGSATSITGTSVITTFAATSGTKTIRTNSLVYGGSFTFNGVGGTWSLSDALTLGSTGTCTLTAGTLNLAGYVLTTGLFASTGSVARSLLSSSVPIVITGNAATVISVGTSTNLTVDVTPTFNLTYSGSTGTRTVTFGVNLLTGNLAAAPNINVTAGSDIVTTGGTTTVGNLNFTGFTGTFDNATRNIYGNLTLVSGMATPASGALVNTFIGVSSQTITTAGKTLDFPITFDGIGGTWSLQDALTLGSTQTLTMTNGTLKLKSGTTNTVGAFATSGTNQKFLSATTPGSQATLSDASGTDSVDYLTIQDSAATGGATWLAYVGNLNIDAGNNTGWVFFNNVYTRTVTDSATVTDVANVGVTFNATISDLATLLDSTSSALLWNLIDDSQTPNWQNIDNNQLPGWQDINTI